MEWMFIFRLLFALNFILLLVIMCLLVRYRTHFPIQERSPLLTILSMIGLFCAMESLTYGIIYNEQYYLVQIGTYSMGMQLFLMGLFCKQLRLAYAFHKKESPICQRIVGSELRIAFAITLIMIASVIYYYLMERKIIGLYNYNYYLVQFLFLGTALVVIVTGYLIRNIYDSYRLRGECFYVTLLISCLLAENYHCFVIDHGLKNINFMT
jgi:hypothetical protein